MSLIELPKWVRKFGAGEVNYVVGGRHQMMPPMRLPPDLERDLSAALTPAEPFGARRAPPRTAQIIADEIAHLRHELTNARELVKAGEAKEATLVAELTKAVDEEIAAKKAAHDADVAELESLRLTTGEGQ